MRSNHRSKPSYQVERRQSKPRWRATLLSGYSVHTEWSNRAQACLLRTSLAVRWTNQGAPAGGLGDAGGVVTVMDTNRTLTLFPLPLSDTISLSKTHRTISGSTGGRRVPFIVFLLYTNKNSKLRRDQLRNVQDYLKVGSEPSKRRICLGTLPTPKKSSTASRKPFKTASTRGASPLRT
jgi:hypothetical protein